MADSKKTKNADTETIATEEVTSEKTVTNAEAETAPTEKKVLVRIPITSENQSDVFVSVNMRTWLIKRGEDVEVPECVAEVLRHQEDVVMGIVRFNTSNAK